jgi:hypothetical protein
VYTRTPIAVLGVCLLALGGCGESKSASSFQGQAPNALVFVQWRRNGDHLVGSLQQAWIQYFPRYSVKNDVAAFTGSVSGSSVTLRLGAGLGSVSKIIGTLNGNRLLLDYPSVTGLTSTSVALNPASNAVHLHAITKLGGEVDAANARAAQKRGLPPLDIARVRSLIEETILSQHHIQTNVLCPSVVPQETGRTFTCTATSKNGIVAPVKVTVQNKGYVTFETEAR